MDDAQRLLAWANDPTVRAASFHARRIGWDEHRRWLAARLASPNCRLLIGVQGEMAVGQVRFDRNPAGTVEIGISVGGDARRRGVGAALLGAALEAVRADVAFDARAFVARVRVGNDASIRLFRGAGFRLREEASCDGVPCLVYELAS